MPTTEITNHYEVLEVPFHATLKDINHAYKRLALKHHPDKAVNGDVDKFQQIQEAAETLRDPYRRKKHDHDLRAQRIRQAYADGPNAAGRGGRGFYTKWMPRTFGTQTKADFHYMYSYANSVHMNPYSRESREERDRIEREKRIDEMLRARGRVSAEDVLQRFEQKEREAEEQRPEKERRRQEAYRARLEREDESDDGEGLVKGEGKEKRAEEVKGEEHGEGQEDEHKEVFGEKYEKEQEGDYEEEHEVGHGEELGQDENVQQAEPRPASPVAEAVPKNHGNEEEDNHSSNFSGEVSSEYGTAQESEYLHSDEDDDGFSYHKPTIDEDDITMFFDCVEDKPSRTNNTETTDTDSSEEESETSDEKAEHKDNNVNNYNYNYTNKSSLLAPFIPYFMAKLNEPSGKYTENDLQIELRGIVMEAYCGWLEDQCATFSAAKPQPQPSLFTSDATGACLHLGYWKKEFERPECEVCHRWKPIFTLTCPGCGNKACVGCKFEG